MFARLSPYRFLKILVLSAFALSASCAGAQEDAIRKAISERLPKFPKIDEITKGPMGLYELRVGADIFYADETGNYLIQGHIIDTRQRVNLTQDRIDKITAQLFSNLPMADLIVWKQGAGSRKMVIFSDPNCSYCRRLERDIQQLKDVTVYTVVLPVLGPDSQEKSKQILCAKDRTKAWLGLMLDGVMPHRSFASCDGSVVERNLALGMKYKVNGTPTIIFEDGKLVSMALNREELEKQLAASSRSR
jgi:thiol:disulfide interchange protein DsbC